MSRSVLESPEEVVIASSTLAADRNGTINVRGYNQVTLYCEYKHAASVTDLEIIPELLRPGSTSSVYRLPEEDVSAPPVVDVNVLTGRRYNVVLTSLVAATTYKFCLFIPVAGADSLKVNVDQTGADADATILIYAVKTVQQ